VAYQGDVVRNESIAEDAVCKKESCFLLREGSARDSCGRVVSRDALPGGKKAQLGGEGSW